MLNNETSVRDKLAVFLTQYKHHIEFQDRAMAYRILEDALTHIDDLEIVNNQFSTQITSLENELTTVKSDRDIMYSKFNTFIDFLVDHLNELIEIVCSVKDYKTREKILQLLQDIMIKLDTHQVD